MLNKIINKAAILKRTIHDHHRNKYVSYLTAIQNLYKFRNIKYEMYDLESARKFKTSDTVFILGAGPSLNMLQQKHFETISKHDTFGINFTFLKKEILPTFHQISYETSWGLPYQTRVLSSRRKSLNDTVFFLNNKALYRMGHPRITPYYFSEEPKCCLYELPDPISLERPRPFTDSDFDRTVFYRGTLTIVLELVLKLGYKNIVLLGVDPDKVSYFFEDMEEMKPYCDRLYKRYRKQGMTQYENMVPKGNKFNTIDVYLYALKDYLSRKRDVNLFIGFKNNMLHPGIPSYFKE